MLGDLQYHTLQTQQKLLAMLAPAVAGKRSISANHPMAWQDDRHTITVIGQPMAIIGPKGVGRGLKNSGSQVESLPGIV